MVDDAATLAEGVASVQVTLADEPDSTEAVGDADIEAADDESAETDESADDEAALTLEEAEEVVAAAQEEAAAGAAESDGDIGGGGGEEAAPIGLRVDRANPVPPKAPRKENPNLIRRGTDPALDTRFAEARLSAAVRPALPCSPGGSLISRPPSPASRRRASPVGAVECGGRGLSPRRTRHSALEACCCASRRDGARPF